MWETKYQEEIKIHGFFNWILDHLKSNQLENCSNQGLNSHQFYMRLAEDRDIVVE